MPRSRSVPADAVIGFYPTDDLDACRRFYGDLLGLPLARDQGRCLIFRVAAGGLVGFCLHDAPLPPHPGLVLTLVTDDVDAAHVRLAGAGVEIEGPPRASPEYGIYHLFARGPDGLRVEIQRFDDPLPNA